MADSRRWAVINVSLSFIALLLLFNLIGIKLPSLGQALSTFDPEEPLCLVQVGGQYSVWKDLPRCCLEAQAQLDCLPEAFESTDFACKTSDQLQYRLNNKALSYCQGQVFWRKR